MFHLLRRGCHRYMLHGLIDSNTSTWRLNDGGSEAIAGAYPHQTRRDFEPHVETNIRPGTGLAFHWLKVVGSESYLWILTNGALSALLRWLV